MAKRDINEFDFDYTPLNDPTVVKWLVENRQAVESYMEYKTVIENIIITYADLDDLIARSQLSKGQRTTIDLVMQGYTMTDIQDCYGGKRQGYRVFYDRAVRKICAMCDKLWSEFYGDAPARGRCY